MTYRFSHLFGSAALAAILSSPAAAQEYSNGGKGEAARGPAILTPVEAYGVHPPGLAPADAQHYRPYVPYYAPLSPVASSTRWRPWANYFLLPYYTPYYSGYSPNRHWNPPPRPYGCDGWGKGPAPEMPVPEDTEATPLQFGPYTSVVEDDTTYWNMGGNGSVPYGEFESRPGRTADIVDEIQASRPRGRGHGRLLRLPPGENSPVVPPPDVTDDQQQGDGRGSDGSSRRRTRPGEPIPPGDISVEPEDDLGPDRSSDRRTKPANSLETSRSQRKGPVGMRSLTLD